MIPDNLLRDLPTPLPAEAVDILASVHNVRIERIISHGHSSPPDFWYDQGEHEWVMVVSGAARLRFAGDETVFDMRAGDHVTIPAHTRHRVDWTTPDEPTVWLAVFYLTE